MDKRSEAGPPRPEAVGKLRNPQWERFAMNMAEGMSRPEAYLAAGYKCAKGNANRVCFSLLKAHPEIEARTEELLAAKRDREIAASREAMTELKITKTYVLQAALDTLEIALARKRVRRTRTMSVMAGDKGEEKVFTVKVAEFEGYAHDLPVASKMVELLGREHGLFIETKKEPPTPFEEIPPEELPDALKAIRDAIAKQEATASGDGARKPAA